MELSKTAVIDSLTLVGLIMIIAGFIAVVTFLSLTASRILMIHHFGLLAGRRILSAMILEMTFIPTVRSLLPPPRLKTGQGKNDLQDFIDRTLSNISASVVLGKAPAILIGGTLVVACRHIRPIPALISMSGDPQDFDNYVDNEYQKALIWVFLKNDSIANARAIYESMQPHHLEDIPFWRNGQLRWELA
jgi:hypothetical protein